MTNPAPIQKEEAVIEKNRFLLRTYGLFFLSLLNSMLFCSFGVAVNVQFSIPLLLLWVVSFILSYAIKNSWVGLFLYTAYSGLLLSPLVNLFLQKADVYIFLYTLLVFVGMFASLTAYVSFTKMEFSRWKAFFAIVGLPLVLAIVFSVFYDDNLKEIMVSTAIVLFGGWYIVYDTFYLLTNTNATQEVQAALNLHLDIRLVFVRLLRAVGKSGEVPSSEAGELPDVDLD